MMMMMMVVMFSSRNSCKEKVIKLAYFHGKVYQHIDQSMDFSAHAFEPYPFGIMWDASLAASTS